MSQAEADQQSMKDRWMDRRTHQLTDNGEVIPLYQLGYANNYSVT